MSKQTAAFFRVEGTILKQGVLGLAAHLAANGNGLGERALRLGGVAFAAGFRGLMGQNDRTMANRLAYLCLRDMSEDRVYTLSEEYFAEILKDKVLDSGVELLKKARQEGHTTVLLTENIDCVMAPLKSHFKGLVDHLVCNRLEFKDNFCTGRLIDPVIGGHESRKWATDFASENDIDLNRSVAYAANGPDLLLLAAVGRPCAVNPDYALRKAAKEADWPVMEYSL